MRRYCIIFSPQRQEKPAPVKRNAEPAQKILFHAEKGIDI